MEPIYARCKECDWYGRLEDQAQRHNPLTRIPHNKVLQSGGWWSEKKQLETELAGHLYHIEGYTPRSEFNTLGQKWTLKFLASY